MLLVADLTCLGRLWYPTWAAQWNHLGSFTDTDAGQPAQRCVCIWSGCGVGEANVLQGGDQLISSEDHKMGLWVWVVTMSCGQVTPGLQNQTMFNSLSLLSADKLGES